MALRMASPWKHPKTGMYWFRRRVPDRLRPMVGKTILSRSLGTKDVGDAKRRFLQVAAEIDREWASLIEDAEIEAGRPRLTMKAKLGLAGEFFRWYVARHNEEPGSPDDWAKTIEADQKLRKPGYRPGALIAFALRDLDVFLGERKIEIHEDDVYDLARHCTNPRMQAREAVARAAAGDYSDDPRIKNFPKWEEVEPTLQVSSRKLTIKQHFDQWAKEGAFGPRTAESWKRILQLLAAFTKKANLAQVTPEDILRWKASLLDPAVSERAPTTANDMLSAARSFFTWAVGNQIIARNPLDGITVKVPKKKVLRKPYLLDDEANLILSESLRPSDKRTSAEFAAAKRWVPWLCAYTGARVNEITQVRKKDVKSHRIAGEVVWAINITPEAGTVKGGKAREVPLHPHIIDQGFLKFVASRPDAPLFYSPARRRHGSEANPLYAKMGEKLAEWVREIGVDDPNVLPNHGWRHRFNYTARLVRMDPEVRDAIEGHAPRTEGEIYGGDVPIEVMWSEIKLLKPYKVTAAAGPRPDTPARRRISAQRAATAKRAKARLALQKRSPGAKAGVTASAEA
jgi:integrase